MSNYLLFASLDPFESRSVSDYCYLAINLLALGNEVTVFLVQNGVLQARPGAESSLIERVASAGAEVLADDFSLKERGIDASSLAVGVAAASLEVAVDRMAAGYKPIWH